MLDWQVRSRSLLKNRNARRKPPGKSRFFARNRAAWTAPLQDRSFFKGLLASNLAAGNTPAGNTPAGNTPFGNTPVGNFPSDNLAAQMFLPELLFANAPPDSLEGILASPSFLTRRCSSWVSPSGSALLRVFCRLPRPVSTSVELSFNG